MQRICWLFLLLVRITICVETLRATSGHMFVHMLHPSSYFPRYSGTDNIRWTLTTMGRPASPAWMHVTRSQYRGISYAFGVPDTNETFYRVQVLARNLRTFAQESKEYYIEIEKPRPTDRMGVGRIMQRLALHIRNVEPYELLENEQRRRSLEISMRQAFGTAKSDPYICHMTSPLEFIDEVDMDDAGSRSDERKLGTIVTVCTKSKFASTVDMYYALRHNRKQWRHCNSTDATLFDANFRPNFIVDWCSFSVENATYGLRRASDGLPSHLTTGGAYSLSRAIMQSMRSGKSVMDSSSGLNTIPDSPHDFAATRAEYRLPDQVIAPMRFEQESRDQQLRRHYFWDWIMVLPVPAMVLIILLLVLSLIFFGHREGQRWRDFKTPQTQLYEYVSLRRGQNKLREISKERQSFIRTEDQGIRAYLVPKTTPASYAQIRRTPGAQDALPPYMSSVGKQTVAEAASTRGAPLDIYSASEDDIDSLLDVHNDVQQRLLSPAELEREEREQPVLVHPGSEWSDRGSSSNMHTPQL